MGDYYRSERHFGSFHRVIPLPEGTITDSAKASFKDGVLEIVMHSSSQEARRGRRLDISESAAETARAGAETRKSGEQTE